MSCCTLLLIALLTSAQTPPEPALLQQSGLATLRTTATVEQGVVVLPFADLLRLSIEVQGDADLDVGVPENWVQGKWRIREAFPSPRKTDALWTQTLVLEPLALGDVPFTLGELRVRGTGGATQTVTWQPISVRVTSRLAEADVKSLRDITAIEELPAPPPPPSQRGLLTVALIGLAALLVFAVLWHWRHRRALARATPESWALYELKRLQALNLPGQGKHERFGTLLAHVLRRYLEKRHGLAVRRQTTAEFLASLAHHPELEKQRAFFEELLHRCDILKFAPVEASVEQCAILADEVRQYLTPGGTRGTGGTP